MAFLLSPQYQGRRKYCDCKQVLFWGFSRNIHFWDPPWAQKSDFLQVFCLYMCVFGWMCTLPGTRPMNGFCFNLARRYRVPLTPKPPKNKIHLNLAHKITTQFVFYAYYWCFIERINAISEKLSSVITPVSAPRRREYGLAIIAPRLNVWFYYHHGCKPNEPLCKYLEF